MDSHFSVFLRIVLLLSKSERFVLNGGRSEDELAAAIDQTLSSVADVSHVG
jgi:TATA-box binding protein (TBP) (component of TFIID and TFIIIB)